MTTPFLSARWERLIMLNYVVDPAILQRWLPAHTELDIWNGNCYVSVVGFMFKDTRVKGFKIPWHINFEEINLRFYVRRTMPDGTVRRAVVFISEIVPKFAIVWVANTIYRERYSAFRMHHHWVETPGQLEVDYGWRQHGRWNTLGVRAEPIPIDLKPGSEAAFITEHYWGYSRHSATKTIEYQVDHPGWRMHHVISWHADIDFGGVYGPDFEHLKKASPISVFLAEGSAVTVMPGGVI
jgi:uncharacterized protein YqjF (DUF2071 family)